MQKVKAKAVERISKTKVECCELIEKVEREYSEDIENEVEAVVKECEEEVRRRWSGCRIGLGHLHNLVAYYHWKKYGSSLEEVSLSSMTGVNFESMGKKLDDLETKQKRVRSEVDWLKTRSRKDKDKDRNKDKTNPTKKSK